MDLSAEKYRGIHPGIMLGRALQKRGLKKGPFATRLCEYPQTLNEITKGRRKLTPALALKIDHELKLAEGTMLVLQAYYDLKKEKEKMRMEDHPNLAVIRKIIFWDTDINRIEWQKQYKAVIKRVFERGNTEEKEEILRYYGKEKIKEVTGKATAADNFLSIISNSTHS